jgi:cytochrome P450
MSISSQPLPYFDIDAEAWTLNRYADVAAAMRESALIPSGAKTGAGKASSGKEHLEMREETSRELTFEHLVSWQRTMEGRARELVMTISAGATVDLLEDYGRPFCLTTAVIVSHADPHDLVHLSELARIASASAADPGDDEARAKAKSAGAELRRSFPPGPSPLRGPGFVALSQTLLSLLTNIWASLAASPEAFSRLHNEPNLLSRSIDELLRCAGVPATLYRVAQRDVHLRELDIKSGQRVILKLSSAHRDPEAYPNPERLDLDRRGPPPLSLGLGEHSCVGAGLIRMAITVGTGALTGRFNSIRMTEALEWQGGGGFRSPKNLRLTLM